MPLEMIEGANEYYEYTKTLSKEEAYALTAGEGSTFLEMVGVEDRFGQVGAESFLREEYGLTAAHIVEAAKKAIARKNG